MKESFIKAVEALSDVPWTVSWDTTPLYDMVNYENVGLIQFLVFNGGLLGLELQTLLQTTLRHIFQDKEDRKEWRTTENCLTWGADPNYRFHNGYPWMWHAIKSASAERDQHHSWTRQEKACRDVQLLLDHGADPNSVGSLATMDSMLHAACLHFQPQIVQALLKAGAHPNAKDARGRTPLFMLFEECWLNVHLNEYLLDMLLADPRVKIDEPDNDGCTPLGAAASCIATVSREFAKKVVRMPDEVDMNYQDKNGETPFSRSIAVNEYDIIRLLLAQDRLDPNLGPIYAFPLFLAVRLNQQQTVEYLLDSERLNVNKQTSTGQTALLEAIRVGNTCVIRMLAKACANADIGMSEGRTARQQMSAAGIYIKWKTSPI